MTTDHDVDVDVAIVGGGAAGLSAALVLGRARRRVVVIDGGEPRNAPAAHMQGFLSRDGTPPLEFLAVARREVRSYGVTIVEGKVDDVAARPDAFAVAIAGGAVVSARRLLVATGVSDHLPDIPGLRERWGRDVLHCPYCHGWEVRDQRIAVLGTHPAAVQHAQLVRQWSDDVVFFTHGTEITSREREALAARDIAVVDGTVAEVVVEHDRLVGVALADGAMVARDAVFVRPDNRPHPDGLVASLGCEIDGSGFPVVDRTGRTGVAGVWAAGNAVDPRGQVIMAAGAGSAAAMAINADLVEEDVRDALGNREP